MQKLLLDLFEWLPDGPGYYSLLGIIAFLESIVGFGLLIPGSFLVVFAGFLALHGKGSLLAIMAVTALGAYLGDLLSYGVGARFGTGLFYKSPLKKRRDLLGKAEIFFADHGGKSIFFGRFLGPLRGFIPFVAGGTRMRPWVFNGFALVSGILWGLAYPGLGYLGGASWKRVQVLTGRFSLLLGALLILFLMNGLFWKKAFPSLTRWFISSFEQWQHAWQKSLRTGLGQRVSARFPRLWSFLADRLTLHRGSGLYLTVGFTVCTLFAVLFLWTVAALPWMRNIDQRLFALFGGARPPLAEGFMWIFACMAERPVLLAWMLLVLLWLVLKNRDFSATILLAGMAGSELLGLLLSKLLYPPPFLLPLSESGEIPTGTAIDPLLPALTLCGLVLYFFLGTTKDWRARLRWIMAGSFVALLIGFSRIYLGFSFFSSSLAEFAMAAAWLSFLITAAEVRRRYAGEFPWRPGWQPLLFSGSTRRFILALALVMTLWWVGAYTLQRLPKELNPSIACISQEILLTSSAGKII